MSDRRAPRFDALAAGTAVDDYSAELPTWPPRATDDSSVSSQGAFPAQPAAPSASSASAGAAFYSDSAAQPDAARREEAGAPTAAPMPDAPAFTLSEPVQMLVMMIGAYHRESDTAAIERAVAHYAGVLGIHLLARPMEDQARAPP